MNPISAIQILHDVRADAGSLAALQRRRLQRLVTHAATRVPYYRKLFREAGIRAADIRTADDLRRVPITSRRDVQSCPEGDLVPDSIDPRTLRTFTTSGTTGRPLSVRMAGRDASINQWLSLRMLMHYGMKPWHTKMSLRGSGDPPPGPSRHERFGLYRRAWMSAQWPQERWIQELRNVRPDYLFGYCLTLRLIARTLRMRGIDDVRLRAAVTTSGVLDAATRKEIAEGFQCPVYDVYASWEGGMLAWECRACGLYHVNADWAIVEILKDGRPAQPGEEGEVVVTNLHSWGMPFLRYRQGDLARLPDTPAACRCALPVLESIAGRTADMIALPSGITVSPHAFFHLLDHTDGVDRWRLVQTGRTAFRVEVVPGPGFGPEAEQALRIGLGALMGGAVEVDVERLESLPWTEDGKFRAVVSEMPGHPSRRDDRPPPGTPPP